MYNETLDVIQIDDSLRIRIVPDYDAVNPREDMESVVKLCLSHRKYDLPMEDETGKMDEAMERGGYTLAARYLSAVHNAVVVPVWGYEHGSLHLRAGDRSYPFSDPWDSGLAGLAYVLRDEVTSATGHTEYPGDAEVVKWIQGEVETYDTWANGGCVGFICELWIPCDHPGDCVHCGGNGGEWIESEDGGSCFGFYSVEDAVAEAKCALGVEG